MCINIDRSIFRGTAEASIKIKEIRFSQNELVNDELFLKSERVYEKFRRGNLLTAVEANHLIPSRDFLAEVYRFFVKEKEFAFDIYFSILYAHIITLNFLFIFSLLYYNF